jgi:hypothetical protein
MVKEDVKELLVTIEKTKYINNLFDVMNSSLCVVNTQINDVNLKNNSFIPISTRFNIKEALNEILESY